MIGNDVVDLALAATESNWKRNGYLQKIFTEKEQRFIFQSENQNVKVWELWSRKESAYKIFNRSSRVKMYNPIQFECLDDGFNFGKVRFKNTIYLTRTTINSDCVYTIAVLQQSDFDKIITLGDRVDIRKENNLPYWKNQPVSISHHGRFERIITLQTEP